MPTRFAPPDGLGDPREITGATVATAIARGSYVTAGQLGAAGADRSRGGGLRVGERAVELNVAGGTALTTGAGPGTRVDVLVTTDAREHPGRTFVALEDVELLDLRGSGAPAGDGEGAAARATARATLRVTARQAVYLTAAESFAREVRLLPRPAGDRRRVGRSVAGAP